MRAAPIGLFYHCDLGLASRYADLQSLPTHCGPAARAGSIAIACAVALCLKGFPKETVIGMASSLSFRADKEFSERLSWVSSLLDMEPEKAMESIGTSPAVFETVPAAFYCFLKFEPEEALIFAASSGGDTDSIASMVGALFGASRGTSWIPERWLSCLEDKERIVQIGKRLAGLSSEVCSLPTKAL
jgi:ADP-ribosyl-[dinitrogen reductase] hydrolase